jgi:hypothetical protein
MRPSVEMFQQCYLVYEVEFVEKVTIQTVEPRLKLGNILRISLAILHSPLDLGAVHKTCPFTGTTRGIEKMVKSRNYYINIGPKGYEH